MHPETVRREPVFNLPGIVVVLSLAFVLIHVARAFLSPDQDLEVLARFAFVPDRLLPEAARTYAYPGGPYSEYLTFVSYAFLHADFLHLVVNVPLFAAFGAVLVRRMGGVRFVVLSIVGAIGAAAAHLLVHYGEATPVIGASGIVSAFLGATTRFGLQPGGAMRVGAVAGRGPDVLAAARVPAATLLQCLTDRRVLQFVAAFLAMNLVIVFGAEALVGPGGGVAWEAHIGGFLTGFLVFPLVDPIGPARRD
jgi:membrane associated rhomboid family serine protease